MSTLRHHLRSEVHAADAKQWDDMHDGLSKMASTLHGMHKTDGMKDDEEGPHKQLGDFCQKLADGCAAHADHHRTAADKCMKAEADELGKSAGTSDLEKRLRHLEDTIIPTNISAVTPNAPGVRAVPRAGQQPITDRPNVPIQFEHLVKVEE